MIIGLLEQLLRSAQAGRIDGMIVGVLCSQRTETPVGVRRVGRAYAAGDVVDAEIETGLSEVAAIIGEQGYKQFHWSRIPQVQVMP